MCLKIISILLMLYICFFFIYHTCHAYVCERGEICIRGINYRLLSLKLIIEKILTGICIDLLLVSKKIINIVTKNILNYGGINSKRFVIKNILNYGGINMQRIYIICWLLWNILLIIIEIKLRRLRNSLENIILSNIRNLILK